MSWSLKFRDLVGRGRGWLRLVGAVMALLLACAGEQKHATAPGAAQPRGMVGQPTTPTNRGPFRVAFAGPTGSVSALAQLQVVFSEPVRALELAADPGPAPVRMTPEAEGQWQWVGTRALTFVPKQGRLKEATRYVVVVPKGVKALSGQVLNAEYRWEFSTPRPAVVSSEPGRDQTGLVPSTVLQLRFNQPVSTGTLKAESGLFAITAGKLRPLPFNVVQPKPTLNRLLEVRPSAPLPIDSRIEFRITDKLGGMAGPLLSDKADTIAFQTYGPLRVQITCSRPSAKAPCEAGSSPSLDLSNPVKVRSLRRAVRVEPPVKLSWDSWQSEDEPTTWLSLSGAFLAGQKYSISIDPSLKDEYGQALQSTTKAELSFGDHPPRLSVGVEGEIFEATASPKIPIASVNLSSFKVTTVALSPKNMAELGKYDDLADRARYVRALGGAKSQVIQPGSAKNRPAQSFINVADTLGGSGRGAVAILTEHKNIERQPEQQLRILQVTDLALTAKLSQEKALVWVTRLSTGKPVAGATVETYRAGKSPQRALTDAAGLAEIPASDLRLSYDAKDERLIVARSADDSVFGHSREFISGWKLDVPTDYSGDRSFYGLLFTERGLYRPGDVVKVKGIVRREAKTGNEIVAHKSFEVAAESPDGRTLVRQKVITSDHGSFDFSLKLPLSAPLGSFSLRTIGLAPGGLYESFTVAEYRPAEFKVAVESSKPTFMRGERAGYTVMGDYLYGAPMSGAAVSYRITRNPTSYSVPKSEGLITDPSVFDADLDRKSPGFSVLKDGQAKLDAKGRLKIPVDLALPGQTQAEAVSVEADVSDVSRQVLSGSSTSIVHPARFYIGLQAPKDYFVNAPGNLAPEFIALDPSGNPVPGRAITLSLVRRRFALVRQQQGESYQSESRALDEMVATCSATTTTKLQSCNLKVPDAGYFLVVATGKDSKGQEARAAYSVYGIGAGQAWWQDSDDNKLALKLDKEQYSVGDTARLLIQSPFPEADAIVTVERAGVHESRRIHLSGPTPTVAIPVTEAIRPNAFISVELLRPRTEKAKGPGKPDLGAPGFRLGFVELKVDAEARRLRLALTPNARDFRPGADISVDVSVKDSKGKPHPAEVTLYAVDEGVLSLINYHAPDPIKIFTAPRPLQVATFESRASLGKLKLDAFSELLGLQKGAEGGGGGEGLSSVRKDFRQSVYFNPTLRVGADGKARVTFKLPDSLTSYRIMAVASSLADRYGFAETNITTSKPLMARPALPRFLRSGDKLEAGIVLSAKNFGPSEVDVHAEAKGIQLLESPRQRVKLARDESKEVRFRFVADKVGEARFVFTATGSKARDSVEVTRRIESATSMEAVSLYGETTSQSREQLGDLNAIRRDVGSLTLTASSSALVGLDAGMSQLLDYPYSCTEQLASRILPLLPLRELAQRFGFSLPANANNLIERTVAEIVNRQRGDGGFGLWPDSSESSGWVTPYALWVLHEAEKRKVPVPKGVMDQGVEYLRTYLARSDEEKTTLAAQALMLDVLAMLGKHDSGYTTRLAQKPLPTFAKALLLHAMVAGKESKEAQAPLIQALENTLHITDNRAFAAANLGDDYAILMDSETRTTALVLRALLATNPKHPLGSSLARGLLFARKGGSWQSTQETAFALLALDDYRKLQEGATPRADVSVLLGEQALLQERFDGTSTTPFVKTLPVLGLRGRDLVFEKQGEGILFYEARLRYAPKLAPKTSLDRGFFVQKTLRTVAPEMLSAALSSMPATSQLAFKGGDLVMTDLLLVTGEPRDFVVLDDRLAAGMEALDTNLATTGSKYSVPGSGFGTDGQAPQDDYDALAHGTLIEPVSFRQELRDDRALYFIDHLPPGIHHFRYLTRAALLGTFHVPPTKAEEMYHPENFGRTAASVIEVR